MADPLSAAPSLPQSMQINRAGLAQEAHRQADHSLSLVLDIEVYLLPVLSLIGSCSLEG